MKSFVMLVVVVSTVTLTVAAGCAQPDLPQLPDRIDANPGPGPSGAGASAALIPRNADSWWMRIPAGHSGYTACRRLWIVVDTGGGSGLREGRDLIWYEIYRPGDPMVMPDRQHQQVHEMVTFGDCVPWVQPEPASPHP